MSFQFTSQKALLAFETLGVGPVLASATTIAPDFPVQHVSGTTTIETITPPAGFQAGQSIVLIPDGLWATGVTGNIALASTAVVDKALILTYDGTKFYPSY